jgi:hypothetical protein
MYRRDTTLHVARAETRRRYDQHATQLDADDIDAPPLSNLCTRDADLGAEVFFSASVSDFDIFVEQQAQKLLCAFVLALFSGELVAHGFLH